MSTSSNAKVIVGLSGGVDSSVAACILKQSGFQVEALFMKNWDEDDGTEYCQAMADFEDALRVSQKLDIECHTASFSKQYWDKVFAHFLAEYQAGRTPNPDILCNKEIKFKAFLDHAISLGADYIATGHYAQTASVNGQTWLLKGSDPNKDQSYFLHAVQESALAKTLFPVGGLLKSEVRSIARQQGLSTCEKKDSTGICFIGERKFKDFLMSYLPARSGNIITDDGIIIGQHQGLMYHTIGQREGLGIGGLRNFSEEPWYVIDKNIADNELIVAQGNDHPSLFRDKLIAHKMEWLNPGLGEKTDKNSQTFRCSAKIRYRQQDQSCKVLANSNRVLVEFDQPQRAISPGQSIVFYDGQRCLGGGIIGVEKNFENELATAQPLGEKQPTADSKQRSYTA